MRNWQKCSIHVILQVSIHRELTIFIKQNIWLECVPYGETNDIEDIFHQLQNWFTFCR